MPKIIAYNLSNENYKLDVGIVSGTNLSNSNYQANVNIHPFNNYISNVNYNIGLGYLQVVATVEAILGAGRGGTKVSTPYYDVMLGLGKSIYGPHDIVKATIILINKGDYPDRDANLYYYLESPTKHNYSESKEVFKEVPPYNYKGENCTNAGGVIDTTTNQCITVLERELPLPLNTLTGEWKLHAEYETEIQPPITVYKSFQVMNRSFYFLLGVIALFFILMKLRRKK